MNSSTGATAKTIDDPATGPMNPLDSLGITQIPAEDEALRPQVRAFLAQAIKTLPPPQPPPAQPARALLGRAGRRCQPRAGPARRAWHHLAARIWRRWPQPVCALCAGGGIPPIRRGPGGALERPT